jgi:hypothetical protein
VRSSLPGAPDTRRRVVLIEDDDDIAEAMSYQLDKAGLAVKVARTGEEGLEAVRRPPPPTSRSSSSRRGPTRWTASSASRWAQTTTS